MMDAVIVMAGVLFGAGALSSMYRILRGPSVLDRVIASDVFVTIVICALGADMALTGHTDNLPVLLALALFAVLGSLSVARFLPNQDEA